MRDWIPIWIASAAVGWGLGMVVYGLYRHMIDWKSCLISFLVFEALAFIVKPKDHLDRLLIAVISIGIGVVFHMLRH